MCDGMRSCGVLVSYIKKYFDFWTLHTPWKVQFKVTLMIPFFFFNYQPHFFGYLVGGITILQIFFLHFIFAYLSNILWNFRITRMFFFFLFPGGGGAVTVTLRSLRTHTWESCTHWNGEVHWLRFEFVTLCKFVTWSFA